MQLVFVPLVSLVKSIYQTFLTHKIPFHQFDAESFGGSDASIPTSGIVVAHYNDLNTDTRFKILVGWVARSYHAGLLCQVFIDEAHALVVWSEFMTSTPLVSMRKDLLDLQFVLSLPVFCSNWRKGCAVEILNSSMIRTKEKILHMARC